MNKLRLWVALVFLSVVLICALYYSTLNKRGRFEDVLVVQEGTGLYALLMHYDLDPVRLAIAKVYLKTQEIGALEVGHYDVAPNATLPDLVTALRLGAQEEYIQVQIIEGKTTKDLYQLLKHTPGITQETLTQGGDTFWETQADHQAVLMALDLQKYAHLITDTFGADVLGYPNLEGLFAPDTYYFAKGVTDTQVLQTLLDVQMTRLQDAWESKAPGLPYDSPYALLTMASIIERETGEAHERPKIAAVFINRLDQGMRLQTDPTIIYGLFDRYDGTIYRSNIQETTHYNTYQIDGLPPTPIALASPGAIYAAAHPEDTDVLYFVATGEGGHTFNRTLQAHNQAVAVYRAKIAADNE